MKVSLLVSTYNRPDALAVYLDSVRYQKVLPCEVVIGDDGSTEETKSLIDEIRKDFPVPIIHVWHEDKGFRLAMMRNKCVAKASGDYIIETDGDIILHPKFVYDHIRLARKGSYIKGSRVNLNKKLTGKICASRKSRKIYPWTKGIESKAENALRLPMLSSFLAPRYRKNSAVAIGVNLSFWRDDFIAVNGYDEFFEGWGCEDRDLGYRLQKSGLNKRYLKFAGIVHHLWHESKYMYNIDKNHEYMSRQKTSEIIRPEHGIDQYLE